MTEKEATILEIIRKSFPEIKPESAVNEWLDELDYIEIVMDVERALGSTIKDELKTIESFDSIHVFVTWLASF